MTKKSSQELLNEILLHMKYDSSLTLSENKEMLMEQNTFYYDNLGNLKGGGPISVPTGARMASKLFPNLNQSQYPKKILPTTAEPRPTTQQTQIPTINRNPKYQQLLRDYNLPADIETKKDAKAIIANRLVSGEYEEFKNKLKTIYPDLYTKLQPQVTPKQKPKVGPKVDSRSYSDATKVAPGSFGTPGQQLASDEQMAVVRFFTPKKVNVGFDNEFEIPGTSKTMVWNENDHNDLKSFSNSVTFKDGASNNWSMFILTGNKYQKDYGMPIGKVKGFSFNYKGVDFTFKRTVTSEEFLNEFGTILNGQYVPYRKTDYLQPSFWENYGPTILNLASIAVAVIGPATWPLLLVSAGLDLGAAKMQLEQGETEGAKLSALLALTPFLGKFAIKVSKSQADALARKFVNASSKQDVDLIVSQLSKEELNTLKSLQELGDINQIKKMVNDPEVKKSISDAAKKSSGIPQTALVKSGFELGAGGAALLSKLPDIKEQEIKNLTRKQAIDYYIIKLAKSPAIANCLTDEEKDVVYKLIPNMVSDFTENIIQKSKIIKQARERKRKEKLNEMNKETQQKWNEIDRILSEKLKSLEEPLKNVENGKGDEKLSNLEIDNLIM
jgi:hypothetical protein